MLTKLSIILFSNSHNFAYYAHKLYLAIILTDLMFMALPETTNQVVSCNKLWLLAETLPMN